MDRPKLSCKPSLPLLLPFHYFLRSGFYSKFRQLTLCFLSAGLRRQAECAKTARIQMALPMSKPGGGTANNLYEELGDNAM